MTKLLQLNTFYWVFILLVCSFLILGCGRTYQNKNTPAELIVNTTYGKNISRHQTYPVKPGDTFVIRSQIEPPSSKVYSHQRTSWSWKIRGDTISTGSTVPIRVPDESTRISLDAVTFWKKEEPNEIYVRDKFSRTIHLAVGRKREVSTNSIGSYKIGRYPRVRNELIWHKKHLVTRNPDVPIYYTANDTQDLLTTIAKGRRLKPTESDPKIQNSRVQITINNKTGWIPIDDITAPQSVIEHPKIYEPPRWYFPVTGPNSNGTLVPGIVWGSFDHDRYYRTTLAEDYPHFIPIRPALLQKIRGLQQLLRQHNYPDRITLISGFRNPHYNQLETTDSGTLKAIFSRHQYGGAVDLVVDGSRDRRMDDLNDDGEITKEDAKIVQKLMKTWEKNNSKYGGIGVYAYHDVTGEPQTPYVHIDVRGFKARWSVP